MGAIQISQKEYDAAIDVLQKALDKSPDNEMILSMLARASLLKGDAAQGIEYYKKLISLNPESTRAINGLRLAKLMNGQSLGAGDNLGQTPGDGDSYSRDFMYALEAFKKGNLVLALERAQKLHEQYPNNVDPLKLASACYLASAMWANARTELEKVLALEPKEPSSLMNLAKVEVETENPERARTLLRKLLEVQPQNVEAILLLANIEARLVDQKAGIQVLQQAMEKNPNTHCRCAPNLQPGIFEPVTLRRSWMLRMN